MAGKSYRYRKRAHGELVESGQDSFLDIVSNVVGILIILVMIAGVQVGAVHSPPTVRDESLRESASNSVEAGELPKIPEETRDDMLQYIQAGEEIARTQEDILAQRRETEEHNRQLETLKRRADGAVMEHRNMVENLSKLEALVELESRKRGESEQKALHDRQELARLTGEVSELEKKRDSLVASKAKPKILENVPTPLARKVEGHEGLFCLRHGKISHVPMNAFMERLRGMFRGFRDVKQTVVDETIGPIEHYSFHFQASIRHVRDMEGLSMSIEFDYGECIPVDDQVGETPQAALSPGSAFASKLSLYLSDSSTITLFVYPDSFDALRQIKKYLIDRGYTIALRPMPVGQNITVSPHGSASTSY